MPPSGGTITSLNTLYGVSNHVLTSSSVTLDFVSVLLDSITTFTVVFVNNGCTSTAAYSTDLSNCNLVCEGTLTTSETEICGGASGVVFTFDTELTAPVSWRCGSDCGSCTEAK